MTLPGHTCTICGSEDLIALEPGTEAEIAPGGFLVSREVASRAWCRACWPALRASKAVGS